MHHGQGSHRQEESRSREDPRSFRRTPLCQEGVDYLRELVKAGEGVEKRGRKSVDAGVEAANSQLDSVKGSVLESVAGVKEKVEVQIDRIEQAFDHRVAVALNRLGIPSRQDVEALSAKLDELSALLEHVARTK